MSFQWKDYAHGGRQGVMMLDSVEFVRRFLMHVLPSGFVRVRHYGLLANRHRQEKLARCRELLGMTVTPQADVYPRNPSFRSGETHVSAAQCNQFGNDPFGADGPARAQRWSEDADAQLLQHPAKIDDRVANLAGRQRLEQ